MTLACSVDSLPSKSHRCSISQDRNCAYFADVAAAPKEHFAPLPLAVCLHLHVLPWSAEMFAVPFETSHLPPPTRAPYALRSQNPSKRVFKVSTQNLYLRCHLQSYISGIGPIQQYNIFLPAIMVLRAGLVGFGATDGDALSGPVARAAALVHRAGLGRQLARLVSAARDRRGTGAGEWNHQSGQHHLRLGAVHRQGLRGHVCVQVCVLVWRKGACPGFGSF